MLTATQPAVLVRRVGARVGASGGAGEPGRHGREAGENRPGGNVARPVAAWLFTAGRTPESPWPCRPHPRGGFLPRWGLAGLRRAGVIRSPGTQAIARFSAAF